jgi:integrase/recombinase XerC
MRDIFLSYLKSEKRYSQHTLTAYESDLNQFTLFLKSSYPDISFLTLKAIHIRSWLVFLKQEGNSNKSINRKAASIRSLYKFALKKGLVKLNPADSIQAPKIRKKLPVFIPSENLQKLFNKDYFSEDFIGQRDKMILELLYGTGIRLSELINLKISDINTFQNVIKVSGKGNKDRVIPIHKELQASIKNYLKYREEMVRENANNYLILRDDGQKAYPVLIYRIVKKYLELITTVEKKSPHVLRHTFATHLLNKGADLNAIKDLLGHENLAATQIYTHNSLEQLKSIFNNAHPKA